MDIKNLIVAGVVALLVSGGALLTLAPKDSPLAGIASPEVLTYLRVHGAFTQGGGVSQVAQVAATHTLTGSEMADFNVITFTASSTQAAFTATLPASTTFPLSEKVGSYRTWIIENPFTAAATTTTIAAGSGIDLQEPDGQNVVIGINNYAFLNCFRELSSDIVCSVDETIPAD